MRPEEVLRELRSMANPRNVEGMARFGINPKNTLGIGIPALRAVAKKVGRDHALAQKLWSTGIHEARLLAAFVDEPEVVTEAQMESWAADFDSWDVVDQVCSNLFDRTDCAYRKAEEWAIRPEEFVRRAGFVLMASLSVHDKNAHDEEFKRFLPLIRDGATDERNFVKKAVNWALRQIGKRNPTLNAASVRLAREIQKMDSKSARWVASDALRELTSEKVRDRLAARRRG
jgi:3-methyladenine DNA glycosylase AlkD